MLFVIYIILIIIINSFYIKQKLNDVQSSLEIEKICFFSKDSFIKTIKISDIFFEKIFVKFMQYSMKYLYV